MDPDRDPNLFETPKGIRIIPASDATTAEPAEAVASDELDLEESEQLLVGFDPEAETHNTRDETGPPVRAKPREHRRHIGRRLLIGRGSHFVYALIVLTLTLGVLALALTWRDPRVIGACAVITPLTITWFWIRLRVWLNDAPYCYRLLASLGEDAENLLHTRVWRWVLKTIRSLYA